ncbi:MAG: hypothetical protein WCO63_13780, partial [Bacteroidota bacterium]
NCALLIAENCAFVLSGNIGRYPENAKPNRFYPKPKDFTFKIYGISQVLSQNCWHQSIKAK